MKADPVKRERQKTGKGLPLPGQARYSINPALLAKGSNLHDCYSPIQ